MQALAVKRFDQVSNNLPKKIKGTFELPKIHEMILATSEKNVQGFIEFELIKLAERINVSGNLTNEQVEFIASQLIGMYPTETLADFKICFESIAMGKYIKQDKVFKLDGTEIGYAMAQYLDEKYLVSEEELMKERDNQYANIKAPEPPPLTYKRIEDYPCEYAPVKNKEARALLWQRRFYAMSRMKGRFVPKISDKEIWEEGREKPKPILHSSAPVSIVIQREYHIRWIQANHDPYTGKPIPNWMPEDEWIKKQMES